MCVIPPKKQHFWLRGAKLTTLWYTIGAVIPKSGSSNFRGYTSYDKPHHYFNLRFPNRKVYKVSRGEIWHSGCTEVT